MKFSGHVITNKVMLDHEGVFYTIITLFYYIFIHIGVNRSEFLFALRRKYYLTSSNGQLITNKMLQKWRVEISFAVLLCSHRIKA